ncbi:MAG: LysR family hydrogen peroxide-inducible transcriptional activator [Bacteroidia bacterium]|jgi:LysR family hydrogen peroxide-inducible transcriptional activator
MARIANLSLVQLQYLIALDEHRHFIKAAQSCFVTQPTLSMQIKKLEEELEVKLFDRSKQPIIPTDVGILIVEQAKRVLNETRKIENILLEYKGTVAGDLNVGIIPTISPYLMPQLISQISKRYPEIRLNVRELMTDEIVHLLQKDHLDVGIVATPLDIDGMVEKPIFYERFCLYLNPSHPSYHLQELDAKMLLDDKLWLLSEGNCFRDQAVNLCALRHSSALKNKFNYESGSIETLIRIVNLEGGATVIPEWASLDLKPEEKAHIRTVKGNSVREVSLIFTRNFAKAKLSEAFYTTLQACVPIQLKKNINKQVLAIV